ncbi:P-loop containing nucleoside triphosphate hydrolase protein [Gonapodya prolifera JEL478]|uniref:p-loop containing nucleoside triphosphate hydrolase protein n=1 Tax=Gonapodya prolifera (strain JEL478) TaxID=1344416 RepID=A0A139ALY9_GONPJ|nr:P-loop containing nucleoside triphosphate hydrolase protein [Gonapodya prolifera JEL478]|eukprot:KXS17584.1 P-loop containing nucleoside triphosphate hydrolase protein [Gonapodya prolifera JEL478]
MGKRGKTSQPLGRALIKSRFATATRFNEKDGIHVADLDDGPSWARPQLGSVTQETDLEAFLSSAVLAETSFAAERLNVSVVVNDSHNNPFLLTPDREKELLQRHDEFRRSLTIPRRRVFSNHSLPPWDPSTSPHDLQRSERESFLEWRRQLVVLEETHGLLITPYERNLDLWRQLWRVVERSHVVVQIVDARNPLLFRNEDLERYVEETRQLQRAQGAGKKHADGGLEENHGEEPDLEDGESDIDGKHDGSPSRTPSSTKKRNLLLINKADFLTEAQRESWAAYFDSLGLRFAFFSAALAKRTQEEETLGSNTEVKEGSGETMGSSGVDPRENRYGEADVDNSPDGASDGEEDEEPDVEEADDVEQPSADVEAADEESHPLELSAPGSRTYYLHPHSLSQMNAPAPSAPYVEPTAPSRTRILNAHDLLELIETECRAVAESVGDGPSKGKLTVGMVGYPNVGKSSTINALLGEKRVAVSSTPGKTKHFQTFHLSPTLILCDCPGLVFPSFATTKADMVANGVLPVDQLREFSGPSELVCRRVPRRVLEWTYGIRIRQAEQPAQDDGESVEGEEYVKAEELLQSYAIARGFRRAQQGNPDESRAAKYILKDYVNGKILFCSPPPGEDPVTFNAEIYHGKSLSAKRRKAAEAAESERQSANSASALLKRGIQRPSGGSGASNFDEDFFGDSALPTRAFTKSKYGAGVEFTRPVFGHEAVGRASGGGTSAVGSVAGGSWATTSAGSGRAQWDGGKKHFKGNKGGKVRTRWTEA